MAIAVMILLVWILIMYLGASYMEKAAEAKGYGKEYNILVICFFLGIFGYIYVLALPDLILRNQMETIANRLNNQSESGSSMEEELPEL